MKPRTEMILKLRETRYLLAGIHTSKQRWDARIGALAVRHHPPPGALAHRVKVRQDALASLTLDSIPRPVVPRPAPHGDAPRFTRGRIG